MEAIINNISGKGKYIFSTVIINEDDLSSCEARLYCADDENEVADFLIKEGISEMEFTNPKKIGERKVNI